MDADRELFIQQLVAALEENSMDLSAPNSLSVSTCVEGGRMSAESAREEAVSGLFRPQTLSSSSADQVRLAHEAYKHLQFDFPQVHDVAIEALAELYRRLSRDPSSDLALELPLTVKLLDNVVYLNDQTLSKESRCVQKWRRHEGSGLLAAAILLLLFRLCLELPTDAKVNALLSSLVIVQPQEMLPSIRDDKELLTDEMANSERDSYCETYATKEDLDDLTEVDKERFDACPESVPRRKPLNARPRCSFVEKLHYLASRTFASSFHTISMTQWQQWQLDATLVAIIKLLVQPQSLKDENPTNASGKRKHMAASRLYGPRGEWSRYLFILRDRILRFPHASGNSFEQLKTLLEFFHNCFLSASATHLHGNMPDRPHHLVYRVLSELTVVPEFQLQPASRPRQDLYSVIQEIVPNLMHELLKMVSPSSARVEHEWQELATVGVQLVHYLLVASPNGQLTVANLYECGILRTLLLLVPQETASLSKELQPRWLSPLLRLLGECALWHAAFATYLSRVGPFLKVLPLLQEKRVADLLLVTLAFHQHQLAAPIGSNGNIWALFRSNALFPTSCASYLDAVNKLQDALSVLTSLERGLRTLRPAVHEELQTHLQLVYVALPRLFTYAASAEATEGKETDATLYEKETKRRDTETRHFAALRNHLRQSLKSLLAALSSDSHASGRASSKLD